ncbi:hypothetical protein C2S52_010781 [Perilla frutescens var. hirtella]|nr:hypothetical protein C2S52_010781 [Perilla frutescens var. hirtella]KAH6817596.1 hypothetical protein C2S51_001199 [Perilla frutescens var. frutescens]
MGFKLDHKHSNLVKNPNPRPTFPPHPAPPSRKQINQKINKKNPTTKPLTPDHSSEFEKPLSPPEWDLLSLAISTAETANEPSEVGGHEGGKRPKSVRAASTRVVGEELLLAVIE